MTGAGVSDPDWPAIRPGLLEVIVGEVNAKMDGGALRMELVIDNGVPLLRIQIAHNFNETVNHIDFGS